MKNDTEETIYSLIEELNGLKLQRNNINGDIASVQARLSELVGPESIGPQHIGRKCKVLNPNVHQPTEGTIVGFTKGVKPFAKIKKKGFSEIRRLSKNIKLLPKKV